MLVRAGALCGVLPPGWGVGAGKPRLQVGFGPCHTLPCPFTWPCRSPLPAQGPAACASVSWGSPMALTPSTSLPLSRPFPRQEAPLSLLASQSSHVQCCCSSNPTFSRRPPCPSVRVTWGWMRPEPVPLQLGARGQCRSGSSRRPSHTSLEGEPSPPCPLWLGVGRRLPVTSSPWTQSQRVGLRPPDRLWLWGCSVWSCWLGS